MVVDVRREGVEPRRGSRGAEGAVVKIAGGTLAREGTIEGTVVDLFGGLPPLAREETSEGRVIAIRDGAPTPTRTTEGEVVHVHGGSARPAPLHAAGEESWRVRPTEWSSELWEEAGEGRVIAVRDGAPPPTRTTEGEVVHLYGGSARPAQAAGDGSWREGPNKWSSELWECSDALVAVKACCCPCWLVYDVLDATGPVPTPCGLLDKFRYSLVFAAVTLPMLIAEANHGFGPVLWREPDSIPWRAGDLKDPLPFDYDQTVGYVAMALVMWAVMFMVLRGVRDRYGVNEKDATTCLKSACWPDGMLCFQPFFLAQVARHVSEKGPNGRERARWQRVSS